MVDTAKLRKAIASHFSTQDLTNFCFDYFRDVYEELGPGMTKSQQVQLLLDAARRGRMENLLAALENERPTLLERQQFVIIESEQPLPIVSLVHRGTEHNPRRVFISYARQDKNFSYQLVNDLKKHGWQVWIAPDSIRPGEKWVDAINRGLTECGVFLLVVTRAALESRWVRSETNAAIELEHKNEIRFVPLQVEAVTAPPLWRSYQWMRFNINYKKEELRLLLEKLDEKSGNVTGTSIKHGGPLQPTRKPSRGKVTVQKPQEASSYSRKESTPTISEEKAFALYEELKLAFSEEKWVEVLEIGTRIEEFDPDYLDTVKLTHHARKQLRSLRKQAKSSIKAFGCLSVLAFISLALFTASFYSLEAFFRNYDVYYLLGFIFSFIVGAFLVSICFVWLVDNFNRTNINRASIEGLNSKMGIALTFAHRIVEHRRTEGYFLSIKHAQNIPKLSDKTKAILEHKGKVRDFDDFDFNKYLSELVKAVRHVIR